MLMAQGKIIFFNKARLAVDYFSSIGYKCPEQNNPADYFMTIMSIESETSVESESDDPAIIKRSQTEIFDKYTKKIEYFHNCYQKSELRNDHDAMHPEIKTLTDADRDGGSVSWMYQLGLLTKRNFLNIVRLPQTSTVKVIVTIITAILAIILFPHLDGTPSGVQNRRGALFFFVVTMGFNAIQNIILIFPDERPVFLREVNNNMYGVTSYFFAKVISEFPSSILTPVIFGAIVYFVIGFSTVHAYCFPIFCNIIKLLNLLQYLPCS